MPTSAPGSRALLLPTCRRRRAWRLAFPLLSTRCDGCTTSRPWVSFLSLPQPPGTRRGNRLPHQALPCLGLKGTGWAGEWVREAMKGLSLRTGSLQPRACQGYLCVRAACTPCSACPTQAGTRRQGVAAHRLGAVHPLEATASAPHHQQNLRFLGWQVKCRLPGASKCLHVPKSYMHGSALVHGQQE